MRMSCNGCRVLRKGCSENCSIRPCLQWIKDPESQANATVFLAKFYGRAGLMNLINAGPENLRPAIFRSLLYEACGRIVNPIYGSAGLLSSGSWQLCQSAVEAVLQGTPIMQVAAETAANPSPPLKAYDIRHVSKEETLVFQELHKVKSRNRFKRSAKPKPTADSPAGMDNEQLNNPDSAQVCNLRWRRCYPDDYHRTSDSSSRTEPKSEAETDSMFSVETVEASLMGLANAEGLAAPNSRAYDTEVDLELTLGFEPVSHAARVQATRAIKPEKEFAGDFAETCRMELRLDLSA